MNSNGFGVELQPDAVLTSIDDYIVERQERNMQPGYISALDSFWFKPEDFGGKIGKVFDEHAGVGMFDEINEKEEMVDAQVLLGNQKTVFSTKFYKEVAVSDEAFKTDSIGYRKQLSIDIADKAIQTRDSKSLEKTYADAFTGTYNPAGEALASNSHTTLKGFTVDNLETGAMDADNLWTGVNALVNQLDQNGEISNHMLSGIAIPFGLFKTTMETLGSPSAPLAPFGGENQLNIFQSEFGQIRVGVSSYLDSTHNKVANAATSYHMVSDMHHVKRGVVYGLDTKLREPINSKNDTWLLRAKFHEVAYPEFYGGYVGSNGTV